MKKHLLSFAAIAVLSHSYAVTLGVSQEDANIVNDARNSILDLNKLSPEQLENVNLALSTDSSDQESFLNNKFKELGVKIGEALSNSMFFYPQQALYSLKASGKAGELFNLTPIANSTLFLNNVKTLDFDFVKANSLSIIAGDELYLKAGDKDYTIDHFYKPKSSDIKISNSEINSLSIQATDATLNNNTISIKEDDLDIYTDNLTMNNNIFNADNYVYADIYAGNSFSGKNNILVTNGGGE